MYRLQVQDAQGQEIGYQNVDNLSLEQCIDIATGTRPQTQPVDNWPPAGTVYSAVWDDVECIWLADISAEQAIEHYPHCWSEMYP